MKTSKYRYLIPNAITFLSLGCGIVAILLSTVGNVRVAAILILASYVLDLFDGGLARRLDASTEFGLQLDSLVDMVSLGVAPAVVVFNHLRLGEADLFWIWPMVILFPLAGAFRLARFNLLPPKKGSKDSVGLTISTGGATPALAVLADSATMPWGALIPTFPSEIFYVVLLLLLVVLMVSTIAFPPFPWLFQHQRISWALVASAGVSIIAFGFFNAWFIFTGGYLGISLARAGYYGKE